MAGDDRTEPATPRRLQRAREEGHIAISCEVPALAGLGAATLALSVMSQTLGRSALTKLGGLLMPPPGIDAGSAVRTCCVVVVILTGPIILAVLAASVAASLLQSGFLLNPGALRPDFARLNPVRGLKRVFGATNLVEAAKSFAKLIILGSATFHVVAANSAGLQQAVFWLPGQTASHTVALVLQLATTLLGAQVVIAALDIAWVRSRHARQLRMTKEEVRQEARDTEGNPQIKQKLRQLRTARARRRMMADVPRATVIVTNPTHYAIALAYDRSKGGAPRVIAKGIDEVAARIREIAQDNQVPLVANPPLARALYLVDLDGEIPAEHFKVVAEVIAYVWRLGSQANRGRLLS